MESKSLFLFFPLSAVRIKCQYSDFNASLNNFVSIQTSIYSDKAAAAISPISVTTDMTFVIGEEEADEK